MRRRQSKSGNPSTSSGSTIKEVYSIQNARAGMIVQILNKIGNNKVIS